MLLPKKKRKTQVADLTACSCGLLICCKGVRKNMYLEAESGSLQADQVEHNMLHPKGS